MPFFLKVATVLIVTGFTFWYFLDALKDDRFAAKHSQVLAGGVSVVVLVTLALGFVFAGSPFYQRNVRLDEERIQDLQSIESEVLNYWQNKDELPADLRDLSRDLSYFEVPVDPSTGNDYGYTATGSLSFELCAVFLVESQSTSLTTRGFTTNYGFTSQEKWEHGTGEVCFSRTIDPDFFKSEPINQ